MWQWIHWVGMVRRSGVGWERRIFLNGLPFTDWSSCAAYIGSGMLRFGYSRSEPTPQKQFDNLAVWVGRVLTANQVQNLKNNDQAWFTTNNYQNLVLLYRFHIQPNWPYYTESDSYGYGSRTGFTTSYYFSPNTSIIADLSGPSHSSFPSDPPSFQRHSSPVPASWLYFSRA